MVFIGNDGVRVSKEERNGKTYYVCTDGVEFLYDENLGQLLGSDGTEYVIDNEHSKLICNNGNDAQIISMSNGKLSAEFDNGKVYIEE